MAFDASYHVPMLSRRAWLSSALAAPFAFGRDAARPNIVVILADDLGYGDPGCYNPDALTSTPRIDALARQGVRFTDAHSPSAVCTPTRYGLLTGRYCWRSPLKRGVLNGWSPCLLDSGRQTIGTLAKRFGYRTACFGKWHLGLGPGPKADYDAELRPSPNDFGFDEFFGIPASLDMPPYLWIENRRAVERPTGTIADNGAPPRGPFWRGGPIAPGFKMEEVLPTLARRSAEFIRANARRPFLMYLPLTAPHTPWVPQPGRRNPSRAGLYGDFVAQVDDAAGSVLDTLEATGCAKNTLVIFTSDNGAPWSAPDIKAAGGHRANGPWRGQKSDIYEAGHRIPFIARWPGKLKPGTSSDRLVCLTDLYATFAGMLGAKPAAGDAEDSVSFLQGPPRASAVHHSGNGIFAYRRGAWKFIDGSGSGGFTVPRGGPARPGSPEGQLYNLREDPREERDLYANEPALVSELRAELDRARANA